MYSYEIDALIAKGMKLIPTIRGQKRPTRAAGQKALGQKWTDLEWAGGEFLVSPNHDNEDNAACCGYDRYHTGEHPNVNGGYVAGMLIIDIDGGDEMQEWLQDQDWWTDAEYIVKTPSKGYHHYYRVLGMGPKGNKDGIHFPDTDKGWLMDIKGHGGHVQAAGSTHKNGGVYEVIKDGTPAPLEMKMMQKISDLLRKPERAEGVAVGVSTKVAIQKPLAVIEEGVRDDFIAKNVVFPISQTRLSPEAVGMLSIAMNTMLCSPPLEDKEVLKKVADCPRPPETKFTASWISKSDVHTLEIRDAVQAQRWKYRMNTRAWMVEISVNDEEWRLMRDEEYISNYVYLLENTYSGGSWNEKKQIFTAPKPVAIKKNMYIDTIVTIAQECKVDPFQVYIDGLPEWDGVERVRHFVTNLWNSPSDSELVSFAFQGVMVGALRRMRHPGAKHDEMLVLIGKEGLGKSTCFSNLLPVEEWFSDTISFDLDEQQLAEALEGTVFVESAEMAGLGRADIRKMKRFMSSRWDRLRKAYGRNALPYPRYSIIVGTTNDKFSLPDDHDGNRRYIPIEIESNGSDNSQWVIDNRDQLWAEANVMEKAGEPNMLPKTLKDARLDATRASSKGNIFMDTLLEYLEDHSEESYRTRDLCVSCGIRSPNQGHLISAGRALNQSGYIKYRMREDGAKVYKFIHNRHFCHLTGQPEDKMLELMEEQGVPPVYDVI